MWKTKTDDFYNVGENPFKRLYTEVDLYYITETFAMQAGTSVVLKISTLVRKEGEHSLRESITTIPNSKIVKEYHEDGHHGYHIESI